MAAATPSPFDENVAELALLEWLGALGYETRHGPELVPAERADQRAGRARARARLRVPCS